jgi:PKD repeat protein
VVSSPDIIDPSPLSVDIEPLLIASFTVNFPTITIVRTSTGNPDSFTVNWGDGHTDSTLSHTYTANGKYLITLTEHRNEDDMNSVAVTKLKLNITGNQALIYYKSQQV